MRIPGVLLFTVALALNAGFVEASVAWDEATAGDFSGDGLNPSVLSFAVGSNQVVGITGRLDGLVDRDYFSFTLPAGLQLDALTVRPGTAPAGISGLGFIAVQAGAQVTVSPTGGSATGLLGWVHYGENDLNTDILGLMGIGFGASGFDVPLPAGTYSFWIQDTGSGLSPYRFDFGVSAVPETSSAGLLLLGLVGGVAWQQFRRGQTLQRRSRCRGPRPGH